MKHLIRAGALLAMLVIVFVLLILMPAPAVLEPYGFYRGGSDKDVEVWANKPMQYAISSVCGDCHQDKYGIWEESKHSSVSCENCHGPAMVHVVETSDNLAVETGADLIVDTSRELCGLCHGVLFSRPSDFPQIDLEEHGEQAECITCHNPHGPQVPPQIPHPLEGRDDCLLCHEAGGLKPFPENHAGRTSDICLSCHKGGVE